jgi:hypothetical protein
MNKKIKYSIYFNRSFYCPLLYNIYHIMWEYVQCTSLKPEHVFYSKQKSDLLFFFKVKYLKKNLLIKKKTYRLKLFYMWCSNLVVRLAIIIWNWFIFWYIKNMHTCSVQRLEVGFSDVKMFSCSGFREVHCTYSAP